VAANSVETVAAYVVILSFMLSLFKQTPEQRPTVNKVIQQCELMIQGESELSFAFHSAFAVDASSESASAGGAVAATPRSGLIFKNDPCRCDCGKKYRYCCGKRKRR
jgi:uncharacterized protein YecA (UPF0149 family)